MVGNTKHIARADQVRLTTLFEIGCIPCMLDGMDGEPATIHHSTIGGRRHEDQHQKTYGHVRGITSASCRTMSTAA